MPSMQEGIAHSRFDSWTAMGLLAIACSAWLFIATKGLLNRMELPKSFSLTDTGRPGR